MRDPVLKDITHTYQLLPAMEHDVARRTFYVMTRVKKGKKSLCIYARGFQLCLFKRNWKESKLGKKILELVVNNPRYADYLKTFFIDTRMRSDEISHLQRRCIMKTFLRWTVEMQEKENMPIFMFCRFCKDICPFKFHNIWNNAMKGCTMCERCYHIYVCERRDCTRRGNMK